MNNFEKLLGRQDVKVIDGGLATELEASGYDIAGVLWSAAMLQSSPQAIVAAHRAYLDAGAEIVISASYKASRMGFASIGLDAEQADQLIAGSVSLAQAARDAFLVLNPNAGHYPLVAASIGPYGAALADGSEYTGNYGLTEAELRQFHEPRLRVLDSSGADLLACETIPAAGEASVLSDLLATANTPAWVTFSCCDESRLSDGTLLRDACALFNDHPRVLAVGINCTPPQFMTKLIAKARAGAPRKAIVVYPNSGETYQAEDNSWRGESATTEFGFRVAEWVAAGANIIGGCCRVGPAQIGLIGEALIKAGLKNA